MKTTETTPRNFNIVLSDVETAALVAALKAQIGGALPADALASDVFSYLNIRFTSRPGAPQTASIAAQLIQPPVAPALRTAPAAPATPSRTAPAAPAAASPAVPATASTPKT